MCASSYIGELGCCIQAFVEKKQGRTYGPSGGKTMAVFVDDISMPAVNEWGDQVSDFIAILCVLCK
jgi:hypothetical protein